jgi:transitional endoplasmic reticulum ATPase
VPDLDNEIQELYQDWLSAPAPALCARLAGKLRRSGRSTEALEVARKGLGSWPDNISVNVIFGKCALDEKQIEEARQAFEKVISIDPLNLIAIKSLAELHFENKNWNRSIELFEEYLFEYPGDPEIEEMLRKARESKKEAQKEARITGQDVVYPETSRMASILSAQNLGAKGEDTDSINTASSDKVKPDNAGDRAPRSLFDLFSEEECEDMGLSVYEK